MVEWKKIWEVTTWDKKFQGVDKSMQNHIIHYPYLLAKDLFALSVPNGDVKLLSTGTEEGWTTKEVAGKFMCEGEVVSIPWGKSPGAKNPVKYYNGCFVTGDNRIATSTNKKVLNNRFLYFWLLNNSDLLETFYRGAGIQHPSMYMVLNMDVPILPLSEQTRIVGILDTFTASIENLKLQIAERRKQYEYYRDQLLELEGKEGVKRVILKDVCEVINGRAYRQPELLSEGKYRVLRVGNFFSNDSWYYSDLELEEKYYCENGDLLYAWSASFGPHIWDEEKVIYHYHIWKMNCGEGFNKKYMYYWLQSEDMRRQAFTNLHGATMAHLTKALMESLMVPVPSIEEQSRIVSILDTFEASITNLEAQLKQREKQYEYYRNKLLTFE
jgi:type I restriction enzyme S subunit